MLAVLALTVNWWLVVLLTFVGANSSLIQGFSDLVQLILWGAAAIALLVGLWRPAKHKPNESSQPSPSQGPAVSSASNGGISVGRDVHDAIFVTGSGNITGGQPRIGGDLVGRDKVEGHYHLEISDPNFFISKSDAHEQPFDYEIYKNSHWSDLNTEAINDFLKLERVQIQEDFNPALSAKHQFEQFEFVRDGGKPTYGATLCFGDAPNSIVAGCVTKCFYWKDIDQSSGLYDSKIFKGNIASQYKGAISFLKSNLKFERNIGGEGRSDDYEVPIVAIEEAIANALIHREYRNRNDGVTVNLFENKIEIGSPGLLPQQITLESLGIERGTYPRNPLIARVFYLYGHVEQAGTGLNRMKRAMLLRGLSEPEFKESRNSFHVILSRPTPKISINALHQIPPPPSDFTGRNDELGELLDNVESRGVTILGVQGMGGVGKTALALKLAEQLTPKYPDAQLYIDLKGTSLQPLSPSEVMLHVMRAYDPSFKAPDSEAELNAHYRSLLHGKRVLLLLDNVAAPTQVEPLIPPVSSALILTSRQHFTLPGLFNESLSTIPPRDANEFLLRISPRIGEYADTIAELCGYLPLALRLAASALAEHRDLSVSEYVSRLSNVSQRLKLVDASLNLSYELLGDRLQYLWRTLAIFNDTFDASAAAAVWELELDAAKEALSELVKYSVLEWNDSTSRYNLHDLARLFADTQLGDGERDVAQRQHATYYLNILEESDRLYLRGDEALMHGLKLFDLEWQNIQAGQSWASNHAGNNETAARLCSRYPNAGAYLLALRQHPRQRINWRLSALTASRELHDRLAEGTHIGELGSAYSAIGDVTKAVEYYEQALTIFNEIGNRHGVGQTLANLGTAYQLTGDMGRSIEYYERAVALSREIGDLRSEGIALGNLGAVYSSLGDQRRAIELIERDLVIDRETGDRRGEGTALGNLGLAYVRLGETQRAISFYEQALAISHELGDLRSEGVALGNMGVAYLNLGEVQRAVELYKRSLETFREVNDRSGEGVILSYLGEALTRLGEVHEAANYHQQQLAIARETGDPLTEGTALFNISIALYKIGQLEQAIHHAEAALEVFEQLRAPIAEKVRKQLDDWQQQK